MWGMCVYYKPKLNSSLEQALQGTQAALREKEGELATPSLEFQNICTEKIDVKRWLAEMT